MSRSLKRSFDKVLDFSREIDRLHSLADFKIPDHVAITAIARAGCFYDKTSKQIKCHFCDCIFDVAFDAFKSHGMSFGCPLMNKKASSVNVPIDKWAFEYQMWKFQQRRIFNSIDTWQGEQSSFTRRVVSLQQHPKLIDVIDQAMRGKISEVAAAGFYYDSYCDDDCDDIVCPCCNLPLGHSSYQTPLEYHVARSMFKCEFLIFTHGMRGINAIVEDMYRKYSKNVLTPKNPPSNGDYVNGPCQNPICITHNTPNTVSTETNESAIAINYACEHNCDCALLIPHPKPACTWSTDEILPREELIMQVSDNITLEWVLMWGVVAEEMNKLIKKHANHKCFVFPFSRRESFIVNKTIYTLDAISCLAENGIFHSDGNLLCFCCSWNWKGNDLKLLPEAHMTESNNCYFANHYYGTNAIQSALAKKVIEEQLEREKIINDALEVMPPPTKNANENLCKICMESPSNVVCIPCGHVCLCKTCQYKFTEGENKDHTCIICREVVKQYNCCYF